VEQPTQLQSWDREKQVEQVSIVCPRVVSALLRIPCFARCKSAAHAQGLSGAPGQQQTKGKGKTRENEQRGVHNSARQKGCMQLQGMVGGGGATAGGGGTLQSTGRQIRGSGVQLRTGSKRTHSKKEQREGGRERMKSSS
jgi:hypothetical protein